MVEVADLSKRFGRRIALDAVAFHLKPRTITALIGAERLRKNDHP